VSATPVAPPATVPAAPVINATPGDTTVALSWPVPADGGSAITSYKIYRSTTSGTELFLTSTGSTSFNDTGRTNGTTYFYKVSAVNGIGEGPQSNEASATPVAPNVGPQPGAPVLTATPHNGSVTLSWPVPSPGASPISYYLVYRSTTTGAESYFSYTYSTTFSDTAVTNGTTYFYKVTAINGYGESPKSNEASATPLASLTSSSSSSSHSTSGFHLTDFWIPTNFFTTSGSAKQRH
jgi:fibronectin type 3 domain-containing protein